MTWLEQLNTLQSKLVDASPIDVSNELFDAVNLFHNAYKEVAQRATESLHISPYWAEAGRLLPPLNPEMVTYLAVRDIANMYNVPTTWIYLLPFTIQIDAAARSVIFTSKQIMYVNEEGYATPATLMAWHDGKQAGLIDEDDEFLFANSDFTNEYTTNANQTLEDMAKSMGTTKEQVQQMMSSTHIEAPFPHENDDSPVGEA
jgi:hypothetical protein